MKPQNYSLKFQNSLADSRVIPGSRPGKTSASAASTTRNGLRATRKPTKYEQKLALNRVAKTLQQADQRLSSRKVVKAKDISQDIIVRVHGDGKIDKRSDIDQTINKRDKKEEEAVAAMNGGQGGGIS